MVSTDLVGNSVTLTSSNFTIDSTPPAIALTSLTGGQFIPGGSTPSITWTPATDNMGLAFIQLSYSNDSGSTWTSIATTGNSGSYTWTSLPADGSNYRVKVVAFDIAGNTTTSASTSNFVIDSTPPSAVTVSVYSPQTNPNTVSASWSASSDAQSGITTYSYAVGSTPGGNEMNPWTASGSRSGNFSVSTALTNGGTYYFSVRAHNGAQLTSTVTSTSFTVTLPPIWDSATKGIGVTLSGANLSSTRPTAANGLVKANLSKNSGRFYWEEKVTAASTCIFGISQASSTLSPGMDSVSYGYSSSGAFLNNGGTTGTAATFSTNDTIGIAVDFTAHLVTYFKNGIPQGGQVIATGTYYPSAGGSASGCTETVNFGALTFTFANAIPMNFVGYASDSIAKIILTANNRVGGGACTPVRIRMTTANDNPASFPSTVSATGAATLSGVLYNDPLCTSSTTGGTILAGDTDGGVYFSDTVGETSSITINAGGITSNALAMNVTASHITKSRRVTSIPAV